MRQLLRPRWVIAHLVVAALAIAFVFLGLWQLTRHEEKVEANTQGAARLAMPPVAISTLRRLPIEEVRDRRVLVSGVFDTTEEMLVRSQVHLGAAGFHVITPLVGEGSVAVLVNRGWVPLGLDSVPVTEASPPDGEVEVLGWVMPSETRPRFGRVEPEGRLTVVNRVDLDRIDDQMPYPLGDFYIVEARDPEVGELPIPVRSPDFEDNGPHLAYAIQWFGFAVVGVIGYFFLMRRASRVRHR